MNQPIGTLYIVATPIGNLADITLRALEILKTVDLIAAEDTRHSRYLLQHFNIDQPLIALHEHNEATQSLKLLKRIQQGLNLAIISDAGTPLIRDPGYPLVREAHALGIRVVPIPGACALITALSASGVPTDKFIFEGFPPLKKQERQTYFKGLLLETRTLVFYEAPHRILETIQDMVEVWGSDREVILARELTKTYETLYKTHLGHLQAQLLTHPEMQQGEIVLVVAGADEMTYSVLPPEGMRWLRILLEEQIPLKQASALVAKMMDLPKRLVYQTGVSMKL